MNEIDKAWEYIIAVLLAMAGGFARLLHAKDSTRMKWGRIFSELFISGFAGLMVLMVARASGLSGDWVGVLSGISGWTGPRILDIVEKAASRATGIHIEHKNDGEKDEQD